MVNLFNRFWCENCDTFPKPLCNQEKHTITDLISKDVEEHDTLVVQVESGAQEALDRRNRGEEPLVVELDQLKVKWDAIMAQVNVNRVHKEKLMAIIANCEKMKQLPPSSKAAVSIRQNLQETLKEVEVEGKLADDFLKGTTTNSNGRRGEVKWILLVHFHEKNFI